MPESKPIYELVLSQADVDMERSELATMMHTIIGVASNVLTMLAEGYEIDETLNTVHATWANK